MWTKKNKSYFTEAKTNKAVLERMEIEIELIEIRK